MPVPDVKAMKMDRNRDCYRLAWKRIQVYYDGELQVKESCGSPKPPSDATFITTGCVKEK